jgi:hypothetical protein
MNLKDLLFSLIFIFTVFNADAQHQEIGEKPGIWKEKQSLDSNSLLYAFKKASINGRLRYFFMATDNAPGLTDYYANAVGGGLRFETAKFHGFQFGVSGFFTYNIGSSNLALPDPKTNQSNRYEIGLFDITDAKNKYNIERLEELFLKYTRKNNYIKLGKQLINTPFVNLQDGRMHPTSINGLWTEINQIKNTKIEIGWLNQISPRGTVKWYSMEQSIGVYSTGLNIDGTKSNYAGNTRTKGVALVGITHNPTKELAVKFWNVYSENVVNSLLLQADLKKDLKEGGNIIAGAQMIAQTRVGNGGNADFSKRYFQHNGSLTFGANIGWERASWKTSLNFNRITAKGRYLMPREWGRDPFYTFLSRERNEGLANSNAYVVKVEYSVPKTTFKTTVGFGLFDLPGVGDFNNNKYGMPDYNQLNVDLRYDFKGVFSGLSSQLLYVYKSKSGNEIILDKNTINKVNLSNWNLVLNYNF